MQRVSVFPIFYSILVIGLLFRAALYSITIISPLASEGNFPVSPLAIALGLDYSFYSQSLEMYVRMGVWGLLQEFISFYQRPVDAYLGPLVAGPVFPTLILLFDYREGNSLPLSLFYLAISMGLLGLWLRWLHANGVGNFWLLVFALIPNPLWYMLNPSTDLPFAAVFAVFYLAYFRRSPRAIDATIWLTALLLVLLTRPNGYSILLFVFLDHLLRLPGGRRRAAWSFAGITLLLIIFGLYLYPYFITEMQKTAQTVYFFGLEQPAYLRGVFTVLPGWLDMLASWLALVGAKALYFCGLRPSYAGIGWHLLAARAGIGLISLPGLLYVLFRGDTRHRLLLICYLLPVLLGATQDRYNLAVQPILFFFGVKVIDGAWRRLRGRHAAAEMPMV